MEFSRCARKRTRRPRTGIEAAGLSKLNSVRDLLSDEVDIRSRRIEASDGDCPEALAIDELDAYRR